jgi:hypothetical protein
LQPGEPLPYHKHDHPSPHDRAGVPQGYQRHDSFPVETAGLGMVIEHSFDFGAGDGRRFGVFDKRGDGGDIALLSPDAVSLVATEDGGGGFGLWVGECTGPVTPRDLTRSWLIATFDPARAPLLQGETIARLNGVKPGRLDACPARFSAAFTQWSVRSVHYRALPGQGTPMTLSTLVSDHYGGERRDTADHVERFYFTRELGGTRWERWQNSNGNRQFSAATVAEAAARFAATGRCSEAEPPAGGAPMVLIDCREWTRIVPPVNPAGDRAGFFIDAIRARQDLPNFFGAPNGSK